MHPRPWRNPSYLNSASMTSFEGGCFNNLVSLFCWTVFGGSTNTSVNAVCIVCHVVWSGSTLCNLESKNDTHAWAHLIPEGMQDADIDTLAPLYLLLHSEICKCTIHTPILAHTLFLTIVTADSSPLTPLLLLLLVCKEQVCCTLCEHVKCYPCSLRKCQKWHAHGFLHRAEQQMGLF